MESTSKYVQGSCSVFHLFLYHSGTLPSLTWITTIDLQPLSLFLFLPLPSHSPNLHSKQNGIPKEPLKLHHCLFNSSLRWLSEKKKTNSYQSLLPPRLVLASLSPHPLRQAGLFKLLMLSPHFSLRSLTTLWFPLSEFYTCFQKSHHNLQVYIILLVFKFLSSSLGYKCLKGKNQNCFVFFCSIPILVPTA